MYERHAAERRGCYYYTGLQSFSFHVDDEGTWDWCMFYIAREMVPDEML